MEKSNGAGYETMTAVRRGPTPKKFGSDIQTQKKGVWNIWKNTQQNVRMAYAVDTVMKEE